MSNFISDNTVFGFVKPQVDVHSLGIFTVSNLLRDCGYKVYLADDVVNAGIGNIRKLNNYYQVKRWLITKGITRIGFSYRLDPNEGCEYFMYFYTLLKSDNMLVENGGPIKQVFFAGLPDTCQMVKGKTDGAVLVFPGDETPAQTLSMLHVPVEKIPKDLNKSDDYDTMRIGFAKKYITSERWKFVGPQNHYGYSTCGKENDTFVDRWRYAIDKHALPLIRTHSGPYNPDRIEALKEYNSWVKDLANSRLLDVLSIGSSQLTQSNFGENWEGLPNGGGVPVNSDIEYRVIHDNALPMLCRTYSGTKDVPKLARIHEHSLNICWHALSFWWFCELDGRGKNTLLENLREHFETVKYIATTGKPVEPNVSHHFAFRGCDDVTYIISGFLAAKACKKLGVKHYIQQIMLNTPKHTSGRFDLAKGRVLMKLIKEIEDENFNVYLQSRGGLDYFAPNLEKAKVQLAAVTCLMDDLDPDNENCPDIIHVVNYSEAVSLATPSIIKDSIKITLGVLQEYRMSKRLGLVPKTKYDLKIQIREKELYDTCKAAIKMLEKFIPNLYTPEGFYRVFELGFFPVPYLMNWHHKYRNATNWLTSLRNGGVTVIDENGKEINTIDRYKTIINRSS
ncbi:MAG: hypothetical protein PHS38_08810 [Bacteroidales bacterium]|nr:hypothetical protein [Bacteroidales bacterium]